MHGEIDAAFQQRRIDLGGEELLALDAAQRHVLDTVAARLDTHQFDLKARVGVAQGLRHLAALYPGEGRATGAEAQQRGSRHVHRFLDWPGR